MEEITRRSRRPGKDLADSESMFNSLATRLSAVHCRNVDSKMLLLLKWPLSKLQLSKDDSLISESSKNEPDRLQRSKTLRYICAVFKFAPEKSARMNLHFSKRAFFN